jgi:hypothetical protein
MIMLSSPVLSHTVVQERRLDLTTVLFQVYQPGRVVSPGKYRRPPPR